MFTLDAPVIRVQDSVAMPTVEDLIAPSPNFVPVPFRSMASLEAERKAEERRNYGDELRGMLEKVGRTIPTIEPVELDLSSAAAVSVLAKKFNIKAISDAFEKHKVNAEWQVAQLKSMVEDKETSSAHRVWAMRELTNLRRSGLGLPEQHELPAAVKKRREESVGERRLREKGADFEDEPDGVD